MNLAFVTVFLLFVSLPGYALRRSYFASRFSINQFSTNILNEIVWSFIPALFIHVIAIIILEKYSNKLVNLEYVGYLVTGGNNIDYINIIFENIHSNIFAILSYNLGLTVIASVVGNLSRRTVRWLNLDIFTRILSFPNKWHYIFTGEYLNKDKGWNYNKKHVDFIVVDILMNVGGEAILYSGKFEDYYLSKTDNGLDRIIIKYPSKKKFSIEGDNDFQDIPSDFLTIPYNNILNLNISYFEINDNDNGEIEDVETPLNIPPNINFNDLVAMGS